MTFPPTPLTDLLVPEPPGPGSSIIRDILARTEGRDVRSLAGGMPDPALFPVTELLAAAADALADPAGALQYATTIGIVPLRTLLAGATSARVGRPWPLGGVVVTTGSQQALDLVGRVLLAPGDEVAIDAPGYLGAIQALRARRPRWLPVPVDRDGMDVGVLDERLRAGHRPKLVYTCTDFQNPTGAVLAPDRRLALAELAERYGFLVVEDDPYGAIRFDEPTTSPIAAHTDRSLLLQTASKTIAPGLRVGWAAGAVEIVDALVRAKQAVDLHTSTLDQRLVAHLLARPGWLAAHVAGLSERYRDRATTLHTALVAALPDLVVDPARGGLFLWARLPGVDTDALLEAALAAGVAFVPGSAFAVDGASTDTARFSFATLDDSGLVEAVDRLAAVVHRSLRPGAPPRRPDRGGRPPRRAPRSVPTH